MTTDDATVTIAGLQAQVKSLSEACHALGADCVEAVAQANSARANAAAREAERDALAAKLDAAPKVCAIHSYEYGPGPCMTCGAWPPGTRELIAACQTRIAGLESAANERTKTQADVEQLKADLFRSQRDEREIREAMASVANRLKCGHSAEAVVAGVVRLTTRVAELEAETRVSDQRLVDQHDVWKARVAKLEAQPALTADMVACVLPRAVASTKGWIITHPEETAKAIVEALGSVTLPAQDRAEELIAAYVDAFAARYESEGNPPHMDRWHEVSAERRKFSIETMAATLAKLGAAATTPALTAAPVVREAATLLRKIAKAGALAQGGEQSPNAAECIDVARRLEQEIAPVEFIDRHAKRLCEQAGESWEVERAKPGCWPAAVREVLDMLVATPSGLIIDGRPRQDERAAARGTCDREGCDGPFVPSCDDAKCDDCAERRARAIAAESDAQQWRNAVAGSQEPGDPVIRAIAALLSCTYLAKLPTPPDDDFRRELAVAARIAHDKRRTAAAQWAKVAPLIERLREAMEAAKASYVPGVPGDVRPFIDAAFAILDATEDTP